MAEVLQTGTSTKKRVTQNKKRGLQQKKMPGRGGRGEAWVVRVRPIKGKKCGKAKVKG